jgi:polar amino acid transport system permease protein
MLLTATNFLFEGKNFLRVLSGLGITLQIAVISILLSGILGIVFGIIMTSKNIIVKVICRTYLEAMRIIPILVWLFIFFFGIPKATGLHIDAKIISIFVFTLWGMAEMGDIVRGAITSMPKHQTESGLALGLKKIQVYRYIVVPQAVRRMIPAAINLATRMIKTTSLVGINRSC